MGKISLRFAKPSDAGLMLAIYAPYVTDSFSSWEYEVPSRAEFTARVESSLQSGFPWIVAEEDGALLGYAYAKRFGERRGYDWNAELSVYITQDAHGRRIGTALYTCLLNILYQQGFCNCYALITTQNNSSVAFHKATGFVEAARLPNLGYKQGLWLGLSYYYLNLRPHTINPPAPISLQAIDPDRLDDILQRSAPLARGTI